MDNTTLEAVVRSPCSSTRRGSTDDVAQSGAPLFRHQQALVQTWMAPRQFDPAKISSAPACSRSS